MTINSGFQNEIAATNAVMGEEEGRVLQRLDILSAFPPVPVFDMKAINVKEKAIERSLAIRQHNKEIGEILNRYFPFALQYLEKRNKHIPASIPTRQAQEYTPPLLTAIPDGWKPRLTTSKTRQGFTTKNKAGNLRGTSQGRLALLRLRMDKA